MTKEDIWLKAQSKLYYAAGAFRSALYNEKSEIQLDGETYSVLSREFYTDKAGYAIAYKGKVTLKNVIVGSRDFLDFAIRAKYLEDIRETLSESDLKFILVKINESLLDPRSRIGNYLAAIKGGSYKLLLDPPPVEGSINYTYSNSFNCGAIFFSSPSRFHGKFNLPNILDAVSKVGSTKTLIVATDRLDGEIDRRLSEENCEGLFKLEKSRMVRNRNSGNQIFSITLTRL